MFAAIACACCLMVRRPLVNSILGCFCWSNLAASSATGSSCSSSIVIFQLLPGKSSVRRRPTSTPSEQVLVRPLSVASATDPAATTDPRQCNSTYTPQTCRSDESPKAKHALDSFRLPHHWHTEHGSNRKTVARSRATLLSPSPLFERSPQSTHQGDGGASFQPQYLSIAWLC